MPQHEGGGCKIDIGNVRMLVIDMSQAFLRKIDQRNMKTHCLRNTQRQLADDERSIFPARSRAISLTVKIMKPKNKPPLAKSQTAKFREATRALGCDEDEAAFEETLGKIAKAKPQQEPVKPPKRARELNRREPRKAIFTRQVQKSVPHDKLVVAGGTPRRT
jgi:hypothetical protein